MAILAIDFQDGFAEDTVTLQLDGEQVFHKEHMSTQLLLGLAASFETEVQKGALSIRIDVPTRSLQATIPLELVADTYLGVSVVSGKIEYVTSDAPFTYG